MTVLSAVDVTTHASWRPRLGAQPDADGTHFRVWAPRARAVDVLIERPGAAPTRVPLQAQPDGMFDGTCAAVRPGDRYRFFLDGGGPFPDPASRFQPDGVHGASMVVDPTSFAWSDHGWRGVSMEDLVLYELHVGTFTPLGTFAGVEAWLPYLRDLGATAIGTLVIYVFGVPWLMAVTGMTLPEAIQAGVMPFLVGDIVKLVAAALVFPVAWWVVGRRPSDR